MTSQAKPATPSRIKQQGWINVYRRGPYPGDDGGDMSARVFESKGDALEAALKGIIGREHLGVAGFYLFEDDTVSTEWHANPAPKPTRDRLLELYQRMLRDRPTPMVGPPTLYGFDLAGLLRDAIIAIDSAKFVPGADVLELRKRAEDLVESLNAERNDNAALRDRVLILEGNNAKLQAMVELDGHRR